MQGAKIQLLQINSISSDAIDTSEIEENWQVSYEELKKELVEDEEFELIKE